MSEYSHEVGFEPVDERAERDAAAPRRRQVEHLHLVPIRLELPLEPLEQVVAVPDVL